VKIEHEKTVQGNVGFRSVEITIPFFHWHEHCELIVVLENSLEFYVEGAVVHLSAGEVIVVPPYMLHSALPGEGPVGRVAVFSFPQSYLSGTADSCFFREWGTTGKIKGYFLRFRSEYSAVVQQTAELLLHKYVETQAQDCLATKGFVLFVMGLMQNDGIPLEEGSAMITDKKQYERIFSACAYIEQHVCGRISIPELAQSAGYSVSHFSRLFRENVGYSVKEYIDLMKIREARRFLRQGEKSITEIAYLLGFSHPNNFGRVYKRVTGRSPREDKE